jgi:hypothetical protein
VLLLVAHHQAEVPNTKPDRARLRRAQRQGLAVSEVRVVTLRRRGISAATEAHVQGGLVVAPLGGSGHRRNQCLVGVPRVGLQTIAPPLR